MPATTADTLETPVSLELLVGEDNPGMPRAYGARGERIEEVMALIYTAHARHVAGISLSPGRTREALSMWLVPPGQRQAPLKYTR